MHELLHVLEHTLLDSIKILPFLLIAYLIMEFIEHKTTNKTKEAIKKSTTERDLLEKEKKSLITKILGKLGIGSPLYKHSPVPYDMALCLMKILNKDSFVKQDYDYLWNNKDIYERYFRNNLLAFQEFRYSYDVDSLSKEEYALKQRKQIELFEKAVPPLGKMEIEKEIEKEQ